MLLTRGSLDAAQRLASEPATGTARQGTRHQKAEEYVAPPPANAMDSEDFVQLVPRRRRLDAPAPQLAFSLRPAHLHPARNLARAAHLFSRLSRRSPRLFRANTWQPSSRSADDTHSADADDNAKAESVTCASAGDATSRLGTLATTCWPRVTARIAADDTCAAGEFDRRPEGGVLPVTLRAITRQLSRSHHEGNSPAVPNE